MWRVQLLLVVQDKNQTKAKHIHNVSGEWQQEEEEVAVIPPTNAVVHPRTMVVKILRGHAVEKEQTIGTRYWHGTDDFCPSDHYKDGGRKGHASVEWEFLLCKKYKREKITSTQLSQTEQWEQRGGL